MTEDRITEQRGRPGGGRSQGGGRYHNGKESGAWNIVKLMQEAVDEKRNPKVEKPEKKVPIRKKKTTQEVILSLRMLERKTSRAFDGCKDTKKIK